MTIEGRLMLINIKYKNAMSERELERFTLKMEEREQAFNASMSETKASLRRQTNK